MKKLLVIGAGIGQINIVQLARNLGIYVIVVSPKGYPAIDFADELFECDIYDYDRIVEFGHRSHVDAVISDQNDLMVPTVAYVAEKLNLPGLSFQQAISYCDKNIFRSICRKIDVPVPESISVTDNRIVDDFNVSFPWIVKPVDSQSSIGISRIDNIGQYKDAVSNALNKSKNNKAIVEQFFYGDEVVCEGFVFQGKYYNIFFGDRRYFKNSLIPCQTLFPSELSFEYQEKIVNCEKKISQFIDAPFGIIHSEYLVNKTTGEFIIVESAIRGGGVYISSHLVPLSTGLDINTLLINCALGNVIEKEVEDFFSHKSMNASAYVCFSLPEGVVTEIHGLDDISYISGVQMSDIRDLQVGETIHEMKTKGMRKGPFILCGKNRNEIEHIINRLKEKLKIKVSPYTENCVLWE